jgi:hypothetical protein
MINIIAAIIIITAKSCTIKLEGDREGDKPGFGKNCGKEEEPVAIIGMWFINLD